MDISFVGNWSANASSSSTFLSIDVALLANDVLVIFGYQRATTTALTVSVSPAFGTIATPVAVVTPSGDATYGSFGVWTAVVTANCMSGTTNTVTGNSGTNLSIGIITAVFRGVDISSPTTNVGSITNQASASTYSVTGPTGLAAGTAMVCCVGTMDNNAVNGYWGGSGTPIMSGHTNDISVGADASQGMFAELAVGGTAGDASITLLNNGPDVGRTLIFGLKPAPVVMPHTRKIRAIPSASVSQSSRW